jgi:uncharacterized OB-fold protein
MADQLKAATGTSPRPIVPYLKLDPTPHLVGQKCGVCGATYADISRIACSKCGATGPLETIALSTKGKVYVFSVIHQSFPGIKTPYVTAIVDLPEGVSVRATIDDVDAEQAEKEPHKLFNMPVEMLTRVAAKDQEGRDVIAFAFKPAGH